MLKNKVLIKISGSIAAYKVGYLISKLVQNDFEVKTVVTNAALKFIGEATLEGLTRNPVYSDSFEPGKMMSHINLTKWADLTILVPADANTINKFSAGIADNLVTSLFLAHDHAKPYLIAPAMNVAMYNHPATKTSLKIIKSWGIKVLPTEEGYLACGDEGKGKLIDPGKIYGYIVNSLRSQKNSKKILITSGGTKEKIDNVRFITNLSTGKTGSNLACDLYLNGHDVTLIKSKESVQPELKINTLEYDDFLDLKELVKSELSDNSYDAIFHLAAISDYSPYKLVIENENIELPSDGKINSSHESISINFKRNDKIINRIKSWSTNKDIKLIGFKFLIEHSFHEKGNIIKKLFSDSDAEYLVFNSFDNRIDGEQTNFEIHSKDGCVNVASNINNLCEEFNNIFEEV